MSPISNDFIAGINVSLKYQMFGALAPLLTYLVGHFVRRLTTNGDMPKFNISAAFALLFIGVTPAAFILASTLRLAVQMQAIQTLVQTTSVLGSYAIACKYDPNKRQSFDLAAAEQRLHGNDVLWKKPNTHDRGRTLSATESIPCDMVAGPDLGEMQTSMPLLAARSQYLSFIAYASSCLALVFVWLLIHPLQPRKRGDRGAGKVEAHKASGPTANETPAAAPDTLSSNTKW
ncbi:hypothetical protein [Burkholderia sp. Tr-20390]|uniref:hypothetical protein n=1 Tax=Burkholderia sp. Tr-20390 TaxID=2703904 RepID=UPI001981AD40|nr:hypothetical protein [Burkholderia sp. Tr-20390]MBN3729430.1 hypothetical protein [Burkholderia sp. Tr-20390]